MQIEMQIIFFRIRHTDRWEVCIKLKWLMRFAAEAGANGTLPFAFKFKVPTPRAARYILQGMLITHTLSVMCMHYVRKFYSAARELRFRLSNDQRKILTEVDPCQHSIDSCNESEDESHENTRQTFSSEGVIGYISVMTRIK